MSEQINSTLPFPGMEESEALDFDAIFGGGSGTGDTNPFDPPAAQAAEPASTPEQPPETPAQPGVQPASAAAEQPKTQKQPKPQEKPAAQESQASAAPNPIEAAFAQQETKAVQTAVKSLFEKPAVFAYGSAKDEIADGAMTFEELRIAKSEDFPELGEGKRVSWSVYRSIRMQRDTLPR